MSNKQHWDAKYHDPSKGPAHGPYFPSVLAEHIQDKFAENPQRFTQLFWDDVASRLYAAEVIPKPATSDVRKRQHSPWAWAISFKVKVYGHGKLTWVVLIPKLDDNRRHDDTHATRHIALYAVGPEPTEKQAFRAAQHFGDAFLGVLIQR